MREPCKHIQTIRATGRGTAAKPMAPKHERSGAQPAGARTLGNTPHRTLRVLSQEWSTPCTRYIYERVFQQCVPVHLFSPPINRPNCIGQPRYQYTLCWSAHSFIGVWVDGRMATPKALLCACVREYQRCPWPAPLRERQTQLLRQLRQMELLGDNGQRDSRFRPSPHLRYLPPLSFRHAPVTCVHTHAARIMPSCASCMPHCACPVTLRGPRQYPESYLHSELAALLRHT